MKRMILSALIVVALLATCEVDTTRSAEASRPNIVLIMADDVGYECFGCYGSEQYRTPHLDRMAERGVRFSHCYSQPLCTPSRVKLMTGLSNVRNYVAFSILDPDQRTFGHRLQEAGYRTAVVGKWQLLGAEHYPERFRGKGTHPRDAGFDRWCLWQIDKLGGRYWQPLLNIDGQTRQFPKETYGPDVVTDYLLDFMATESDKPFLAYYPMILVHSPFPTTPDSLDAQSRDRQRNFEDMVAYMDKLIGRIVGKTEELGIAEETLILFVGDNGTHTSLSSKLGDRVIRGGKGAPTDAGTRVPMIGYWPGTIPPGRVLDDIVEFSNFTPTLLEAADVPVPESLDGCTFLPQLQGKPGTPREWIHIYYCPRPERTKPIAFVRDTRWKLYADGRFFDVANDPLEKSPLGDPPTESNASKARAKLTAALKTMPSEGQSLLKLKP